MLNDDETVDYYGGRLVVRMDANENDYFYDVDFYNHIKKEASLSAAKQANNWNASEEKVSQKISEVNMYSEKVTDKKLLTNLNNQLKRGDVTMDGYAEVVPIIAIHYLFGE